MKKFEHVCFEDRDDSPFGVFRSKLIVQAGVPERGALTPLTYGVPRGVPVVIIGQSTGDSHTTHGSQLQAILPRDARALAQMLIEAADEADRRS